MKVLVACEYSGRVRDAFTKLGHDAMSCDLLETESPGKHYKGDVREVLGGGVGFNDCSSTMYIYLKCRSKALV